MSEEKRIAYDFELRLRRFDGAYCWFRVRGLPLRDASGAILRWHYLYTDVDERKRTEDALRHSDGTLLRALEWESDCVSAVQSSKSMAVVCGANRMAGPAPRSLFPFPARQKARWTRHAS